jgi:hypothetical protein
MVFYDWLGRPPLNMWGWRTCRGGRLPELLARRQHRSRPITRPFWVTVNNSEGCCRARLTSNRRSSTWDAPALGVFWCPGPRFRSGTVRIPVNHQTNAHAPNIIDDICHIGRWSFQNSTSGVTSATRLGNVSAAARNSAKKFSAPVSPALYRRKPASTSQIFVGLIGGKKAS